MHTTVSDQSRRSSMASRKIRIAAAILSAATLATVGLVSATTTEATAGPVYQAVDSDRDGYNGIYLRNSPSMGNVTRDTAHYMVYGTSIELICGGWGEAVGPFANRRWHYVRVVTTGQPGWIADRYTNTPNKANEHTPGEAECGSTPAAAPAPAPAPSGVLPESWVGSPFTGIFDKGLPVSPPSVHHFIGANPEHDFAFDLAADAGTAVKVYVAPQTSGYTITTKVDRIGVICGSASRGGYFVTVGIYANGVRTGSVTYGHVQPTVSVGQTVSRWGGKIGTIKGGLPPNKACWTGPHGHLEMATLGGYKSCYNGGYRHEARVNVTNFIGFVGGSRATRTRQACP